jgi:DNA-binding protein H-NS
MARGKKVMAEADETDDIEEGKLPPSDLTKLGKGIDFEAMEEKEVMAMVEQAIEFLSAPNLRAVRDLAEETRLAKLEDTKHELVEKVQALAEAAGLSLADLFPQAFASGRKPRSDSGQKLPAKYRGPNGEEWPGRGRKPAWAIALEAAGHSMDEFLVEPEEQ